MIEGTYLDYPCLAGRTTQKHLAGVHAMALSCSERGCDIRIEAMTPLALGYGSHSLWKSKNRYHNAPNRQERALWSVVSGLFFALLPRREEQLSARGGIYRPPAVAAQGTFPSTVKNLALRGHNVDRLGRRLSPASITGTITSTITKRQAAAGGCVPGSRPTNSQQEKGGATANGSSTAPS